MKNSVKKKKSIILAIIIIIFVVVCFFGTLYYITSTVNNYTYTEKNWITENINTSIDIYVEPGLPIFSLNGEGVFFDYINALKNDTGLSLNVVTDPESSNYKFENKNSVDKEDIVLFKDHFVVISKEDNLSKLTDLSGKKVGIIASDKETISYYLTGYNSISYKEYKTFDELNTAYTSKIVDYLIVPMYKHMDKIISSDYEIIYHLDGLYSYYSLALDDKNKNFSSIMTKFYYRWEEKAQERLNEYFLNIYYDAEKYTEIQKESITNEDFIVGYIPDLPYEGLISNTFTGLTDTYLSKFSDISGVTYKYVEYKDTKELNEALNSKKIDIALNYYSLSSENYSDSRTLGLTEYVVLAHIDNNIVVNSLYSLNNNNVVMLSNMNLKYNMASKNLFEIKDYSSVLSLLKNINEESIIIIEKEVYDYYKDSKLEDYSIRFIDSVKLNNSFLLNKDNTAFNKLFDYYLSTLSSSEIKNESVVGVISTLKSNRIFNFIMSNLIFIVLALIVAGLITYGVIKKIMHTNKAKREDRLLYFDAMTNLKNRNYLNDNMDFWSSTKVYPQTIVIIDINKLKSLNDKYGHEVGDSQIKAVASVLIKTQRDNSEIIRTDGDEFLIYLVGYEEKKISSYIHKLNKELNDSIPNKEYGISIGYSMINSELNTLDDAINDSIAMIKKSKGIKEE